MKKILALFAAALSVIAVFSGCSGDGDSASVIQGYKDKEIYTDEGGTQNQAFSKYFYDESFDDKFAKKDDYTKVDSKNKEEITGYFTDFNDWAPISSFGDKYDFKTDMITDGDYYYIEESTTNNENIGQRKERTIYRLYSIYYYDTESHTLYYVHNDIT